MAIHISSLLEILIVEVSRTRYTPPAHLPETTGGCTYKYICPLFPPSIQSQFTTSSTKLFNSSLNYYNIIGVSAMKAGQEIVSSADNSINSPNPNSPIRRLCNKLLSPKLSPKRNKSHPGFHCEDSDEIVIQRVFNYFDENGDGKISPPELQSCVKTVSGEILTKEEAEMAVQSTDSDEDGLLGLEDFSKLMKNGRGGGSEEEELKGAFGMYAAEGTGCITPKSLKRMLSRLGESTSVSNCEVMIRKFDLNGDGFLNFDEFRTMMMVH